MQTKEAAFCLIANNRTTTGSEAAHIAVET